MDTARDTLRSALPIKCLEAVFLGALLTAGWPDLDRLPLAFKSSVQGQTYRHIVLVVFHPPSRKWGALGLSRRPELMDKDLAFSSLADLVHDYKRAYERWWHTLVKAYVGLPLEHDTSYTGPVCWRYLTLSLAGRKPWAAHSAALDAFAAKAPRLAAKFRALGVRPASASSAGDAGPAAAPGTAYLGGGAAAASQRCAKSVSPSRRRPQPQQGAQPASPSRQARAPRNPAAKPLSIQDAAASKPIAPVSAVPLAGPAASLACADEREGGGQPGGIHVDQPQDAGGSHGSRSSRLPRRSSDPGSQPRLADAAQGEAAAGAADGRAVARMLQREERAAAGQQGGDAGPAGGAHGAGAAAGQRDSEDEAEGDSESDEGDYGSDGEQRGPAC